MAKKAAKKYPYVVKGAGGATYEASTYAEAKRSAGKGGKVFKRTPGKGRPRLVYDAATFAAKSATKRKAGKREMSPTRAKPRRKRRAAASDRPLMPSPVAPPQWWEPAQDYTAPQTPEFDEDLEGFFSGDVDTDLRGYGKNPNLLSNPRKVTVLDSESTPDGTRIRLVQTTDHLGNVAYQIRTPTQVLYSKKRTAYHTERRISDAALRQEVQQVFDAALRGDSPRQRARAIRGWGDAPKTPKAPKARPKGRRLKKLPTHPGDESGDQGTLFSNPVRGRGYRSYENYYPHEWKHIATILAPKSLTPVAIYASVTDNEIRGLSPDKKRVLGGGYHGYQRYRTCVRQHMVPGVSMDADKGLGIGATFYLGGALVAKALKGSGCTYSRSDGRTVSAGGMWDNMAKRGLTTRTNERQRHRTEDITVSQTHDTSDISKSDLAKIIKLLKPYFREKGAVGNVKPHTIVSKATVPKHVRIDRLTVSKVLKTGLVIYLNPLYFPGRTRGWVLPKVSVWKKIDFSSVTPTIVAKWLDNIQKHTKDGDKYVAKVVRLLTRNRRKRYVARFLPLRRKTKRPTPARRRTARRRRS